MTIEPKLYSIDDACVVMGGISKATIYRLIQEQKLELKKIFKRSFVTAASVDNFINNIGRAK